MRTTLFTFYLLLSTLSLSADPVKPSETQPAKPVVATPVVAPKLDVKGIDDQLVATKRTTAFLNQIGYKTKYPSEDMTAGIWIKDEGVGFTIRAFANSSGLDRLVISCAVPGKGPESLEKMSCLKAINDLNHNLNVCSFSLTPDGDFVFSVNLGFSDTLDARVFREEIEHMKSFTSYFLATKEAYIAKPRDLLVK